MTLNNLTGPQDSEPMSSALPAEFWQGIEQFNQGEFYACHDTLEAIWIPALEPEKQLYQGIIQIAVALYHLSNGNWRGTVILMGEGLNRLRHYPDDHEGLDLGELRSMIATLLEVIQNLGPERVNELVWQSALGDSSIGGDDEKIYYPRPIIQKTEDLL
jgi:uncharacterized protein